MVTPMDATPRVLHDERAPHHDHACAFVRVARVSGSIPAGESCHARSALEFGSEKTRGYGGDYSRPARAGDVRPATRDARTFGTPGDRYDPPACSQARTRGLSGSASSLPTPRVECSRRETPPLGEQGAHTLCSDRGGLAPVRQESGRAQAHTKCGEPGSSRDELRNARTRPGSWRQSTPSNHPPRPWSPWTRSASTHSPSATWADQFSLMNSGGGAHG